MVVRSAVVWFACLAVGAGDAVGDPVGGTDSLPPGGGPRCETPHRRSGPHRGRRAGLQVPGRFPAAGQALSAPEWPDVVERGAEAITFDLKVVATLEIEPEPLG